MMMSFWGPILFVRTVQALLTELKDSWCASAQALAPKLESMEAAWAGLHTLTGADTPEEIIAFLKGALAARACAKKWSTVHLHRRATQEQHGPHQACIAAWRAAGSRGARSLSSLQTAATVTVSGCHLSQRL